MATHIIAELGHWNPSDAKGIVSSCHTVLATFEQIIGQPVLADTPYTSISLRRNSPPRLCLPSPPPNVNINLDLNNWDSQKTAYQFAHELCHAWIQRKALTATTFDETYTWIEECICEASSQAILDAYCTQPSPPFLKRKAWEKYRQTHFAAARDWRGFQPPSWANYSGDLAATVALNERALATVPIANSRAIQIEVASRIKNIPALWAAAETLSAFRKEPNWPLQDFFAKWKAHTTASTSQQAIDAFYSICHRPSSRF